MKNVTSRVLALMLVLIMAVSVLPMAAMAEEDVVPNIGNVFIESDIFGNANDTILTKGTDGYYWWNGAGQWKVEDYFTVSTKPVTIKVSDYDNLVEIDGEIYELEGMHSYYKIDKDTVVKNGTTSITVPAFPVDGTDAEQDEWFMKWSGILLAYAPHQHDAAYWSYSKTNHWINCTECGKTQLMMNWHSDNNADDICDVCGGPIVYYPVDIAETEHGSVSIEKEAYRLNDIVYIELDPDDGYVLDEIMAFKHRADGTSARLVVRPEVKGSEYRFKMPSFDCEVVVTYKEA